MSSAARIRHLAARGWPPAAIAAQLQTSYQAVAVVLDEARSTPIKSGVEPSLKRGRQRERRKPPDWSPEEVEQLKSLYTTGETIAAIAKAIGRPAGGVHSKATYLGLRRPSKEYSAEEEDFLRRAYAAGEDPREIARVLGRPVKGVQSKASELGLKHASRRPWSEADRETLIACHRDGVPLTETARRLGRNYAAVAKIAEKMGLSFKQPEMAPAAPVVSATLMLIWLEAAAARLDAAVARFGPVVERAWQAVAERRRAAELRTERRKTRRSAPGRTPPAEAGDASLRPSPRTGQAKPATRPPAIGAGKRPANVARIPLGNALRRSTATDQAAVEMAIAAGRVTRCPPRWARGAVYSHELDLSL